MLDLKFAGVQIGTHINGINLDHPQFDPFYKTAEDLQAAIFVHPWDMQGGDRWKDYWLPWLVGMPCETATALCCILMGGVLEKFPRLKFCFAHGGGSYPYIHGRVAHGHRCRPDLCANRCATSPDAFLGKFWTDSLTHDAEALKFLIKVVGEDRICLGSDYPFPLGEDMPGAIVESIPDLSERIKVSSRCRKGLFTQLKCLTTWLLQPRCCNFSNGEEVADCSP